MRLLRHHLLHSLCDRHINHGAQRASRLLVHAVKATHFHGHGVSTLSPLAAAFNSKPQRKLNLSLRRNDAVSTELTLALSGTSFKLHLQLAVCLCAVVHLALWLPVDTVDNININNYIIDSCIYLSLSNQFKPLQG